LSNPEFLAEGTAVKDLLYPDRILIGSAQTASGLAAASVLRSVYTTWVDPSKVLTVNVWSSELAKLVANAMLAQRISSINAVSAICDQTGADVDEVALAIGFDVRLGSKFLKAGLGFGGSCFKKDILSLTYLAYLLHLPEVAEYWMAVLTVNEFQRNRFMQKVVTRLNGALFGKKITVLGYTFKQDTNDTRESPAIDVIKALLSECPAEIAIFDPGCTLQGIRNNIASLASTVDPHVLKPHGPVEAYSNAYDACADSSAVLILTPWKQFHYPPSKTVADPVIPNKPDLGPLRIMSKPVLSEMDIFSLEAHLKATKDPINHNSRENESDRLERLADQPPCPSDCQSCRDSMEPVAVQAHENIDWAKVASSMSHPKWVFDGRNIVDSKAMAKLGFRVENLGKSGKRCMS
jgi:UDPglucose 6-dehydrogenase